MKPHPPPSLTAHLTSLLLLTSAPTVVLVLAAPVPVPVPVPVPAADPLIAYHALPLATGTAQTAATGTVDIGIAGKNSSVGSEDDDDSSSSIGAKIHALVFGTGSFKRRTTTPTAAEVLPSDRFHSESGLGEEETEEDKEEEDWENWHTQWRRQQKQRRCEAWGVCVRVY